MSLRTKNMMHLYLQFRKQRAVMIKMSAIEEPQNLKTLNAILSKF